MRHLLDTIEQTLRPTNALILYQGKGIPPYVESCQINSKGNLINMHPLSLEEGQMLSEILQTTSAGDGYLQSKGILPENLLHLRNGSNGFAIWYTPAQTVELLFTADLNLPQCYYHIPALVWKANKRRLQVFAIIEACKPSLQSQLYHAPFHNIYNDGGVCMGTVRLQAHSASSLEKFIAYWQSYFFGSYFSHALCNAYDDLHNCSLEDLWRKAAASASDRFPNHLLASHPNHSLSYLLS